MNYNRNKEDSEPGANVFKKGGEGPRIVGGWLKHRGVRAIRESQSLKFWKGMVKK